MESKNGLRLGTWKIRTLNKPGASKYVIEAYNMYKMDVLVLQEISSQTTEIIKKII
jgi:hypothetical protein